jgi:TatD DNase family protein
LGRLHDAGGQGVICIGESLEAARRANTLAAGHPGRIWWTAGVHPHDAAGYDPGTDGPVIRQAMRDGAVAVGECGLDYHYDHSPRPLQRRAFADQLALAKRHGAARSSSTPAMPRRTRRRCSARRDDARHRGVLHCYTGSLALAEVGLAAGWSVSFSGIVTFKKWDDLDLLRLVPADRLLVETDSPYLAPVPHRGKRNEPAWCAYTLRRSPEVRAVDGPRCSRRSVLGNGPTVVRAGLERCSSFLPRPP